MESSLRTLLERAFGLFLGRPLREFPAGRYELWCWVDSDLLDKSAHTRARNAGELQSAISDRPSSTFDKKGHWWERYHVDYARSLYVFDPDDIAHGFAEAAPSFFATGRWHHDGPQLLDLATKDGLDLATLLKNAWYIARHVVCDGSLFDAMAAATCSMSAPDLLLCRSDATHMADSVKVEAAWANALTAIDDRVLRDHLEVSCVTRETARFFGSYLPASLEFYDRRPSGCCDAPQSRSGRLNRAVSRRSVVSTRRRRGCDAGASRSDQRYSRVGCVATGRDGMGVIATN